MSHNIKSEVEDDYLKFIVFGQQTPKENVELLLVIEECLENKVDKVIVDLRSGFW